MDKRKAETNQPWPSGSEAGKDGGTFKREGPTPGNPDTGTNVPEMNEKARESVITNVTPDQQTD